MSEEPSAEEVDTARAETTLPRGITTLVEAALHSPAPSSEAEAAAQERAQAAYQEAVTAPRPLHPDPWHSGPVPLATRLSRFFRRLRGG